MAPSDPNLSTKTPRPLSILLSCQPREGLDWSQTGQGHKLSGQTGNVNDWSPVVRPRGGVRSVETGKHRPSLKERADQFQLVAAM